MNITRLLCLFDASSYQGGRRAKNETQTFDGRQQTASLKALEDKETTPDEQDRSATSKKVEFDFCMHLGNTGNIHSRIPR